MSNADRAKVKQLAAAGAVFTCGPADEPPPLDDAVMRDDPALVLALLEAHADPNARWSSHGDRFPLQGALETLPYRRHRHRHEILRILLAHGADPNQRWCPFESRGGSGQACVSRYGVTPLMWAAVLDEPATTFLLLHSGAEPTLENQVGANALDLAYGEAVFYQLASAISAKRGIHPAGMLRYFNERDVKHAPGDPWDETPLTRAIVGDFAGVVIPPPPPDPPTVPGVEPSRVPVAQYRSPQVGRVRALLEFGADPNQRLTRSGVDWTPLGLAVEQRDAGIIRTLLGHGADPNARWCVPMPVPFWKRPQVLQPQPGCTEASGMTALMLAASIGDLPALGALLEPSAVELGLTDWNGLTAVDYAARASHRDAVYELKRAAHLRAILSPAPRLTPKGK